jgi:predicted patatin/cPLA2 family phospholipase
MKVIVGLMILAVVQAGKCYSLSQGGGGSFGAYEAGAFKTLAYNLSAALVNYSSVVGISVGSLNSIAISQYPPGEEQAASDFVIQTYLSLNGSESVFIDWPGGLISGLLFHSGLYNTAPELKLIQDLILSAPQRKLDMGTVNLDDGGYVLYNESLGLSDLHHATMCSSAIPMLFATQDFKNGTYTDGGTYNMMDGSRGIERCLEETSVQSDITIDILSCFRHYLDPNDTSKMKTIDVFYRGFEISSYDKAMNSIHSSMIAYPEVNFRYFIEPSKYISFTSALDFNIEFLKELISLGISDAQNVISSTKEFRSRFKDWKPINIVFP